MKCTKNGRYFELLSFLGFCKNVITFFPSVFSIRLTFPNQIPKLLGIFLKISRLMENPAPGTNVNKTTDLNDPDNMALPAELLRKISGAANSLHRESDNSAFPYCFSYCYSIISMILLLQLFRSDYFN